MLGAHPDVSVKPVVWSPDTQSAWTLDELCALALQNNPAIRQAAAAASQADGVQNQTGLRPNQTNCLCHSFLMSSELLHPALPLLTA